MEALSGPFGQLVDDMATAWERWDCQPHASSTARRLSAATWAVAECLPGMGYLILSRSVTTERRETRLPARHCIKIVVARALQNEEYEQC